MAEPTRGTRLPEEIEAEEHLEEIVRNNDASKLEWLSVLHESWTEHLREDNRAINKS
jgi:hypothetical protein